MLGRTHKSLTRLLALLMSTTAPLARVEAQNAGNVSAVNPASTGTPPGATQRTLVIGTNVVHKERVETSANGSTQIVFPDTSTLNVGRNSSIVIDEYVYDPNAGVGSMATSLTKGVMRFVGGQISHTSGITVNTPTGTLGVRGGSVTVLYPIPANIAASDPALAGCHGELIIGHVGVAKLTNNAGSASIHPGLAACVNSANDVDYRLPDHEPDLQPRAGAVEQRPIQPRRRDRSADRSHDPAARHGRQHRQRSDPSAGQRPARLRQHHRRRRRALRQQGAFRPDPPGLAATSAATAAIASAPSTTTPTASAAASPSAASAAVADHFPVAAATATADLGRASSTAAAATDHPLSEGPKRRSRPSSGRALPATAGCKNASAIRPLTLC